MTWLTTPDVVKALVAGLFVLVAAFIGGLFAIRVGREKVKHELEAERAKAARESHSNQVRAVDKVVSRVDRCVNHFVMLGKCAPSLTQEEYMEQLLNPVTALADMINIFREEKGNLPESILEHVREVRRGLLGILTSTSMVTLRLSKDKTDDYRLKALTFTLSKLETLKSEAADFKSKRR